jgi:ATP-dependent RNA helicase HelY
VTRDEFAKTYPFGLDPFQVRALDALDGDRSVLVAAPTGSGKTVVAEYAVAKALAEGGKAFYTTPLKALSNQKYGDLVRRHGAPQVGLLTGDNSINGNAPVVVMTTEVLRNMIYAGSSALDGLRYVVLDEVHYLQDAYRGPVWEEVIIHAPATVNLVCLSATVSNAEEFAEWIETVRGSTAAIIEERRPVELHHLYMVGDRGSDELHLLPTFVDTRPNPEAARLDASTAAPRGARGRRGRLHTPRRVDVIERLRDETMLPAIYFIFSRAACNDAVRQCIEQGVRLTTPEERLAIRAVAEAKVDVLTDADLEVLEYDRWLTGLEAGVAAHHAGMVPPFKEAVEACFAAGLVKVVFATETLALGINMPARAVVIEKLSKFTGERHEFLTPGEYTQLTGRAGRRGIDDTGYAIVLWSPFVPFDQVAGLASRRTYALSSSFRPTYNMAANLVRRYAPDKAHHLLNLSFAQYRADTDVVRFEAQLERIGRDLAAARREAYCELGDVDEFRRLVAGPADSPTTPTSTRARVAQALGAMKPGDVLMLPGGKSGGRVAVLSTSHRGPDGVRLAVVTQHGTYLTVTPRHFPAPPRPIGRVDLPVPYTPRNRSFQRAVAAALNRVLGEDNRPQDGHLHQEEQGEAAPHPVASCPDLRRHLRAAARSERLAKDLRRLERRVQGRSESLARQFDRVLRVLQTWGYVEDWVLTDTGDQLARVYHECDLLVTEALRNGLFDDLDPAAVAGLASTFTFEARGPGPAPQAWFPSARVRRRWADLERLATELNQAEDEAGLPLTRRPDAGFFALAYSWAAGDDLGDVIADEEVSGGDFVRNVKQLIDLLRQLSAVAPEPATAKSMGDAANLLFRGVVAASSVVAQ